MARGRSSEGSGHQRWYSSRVVGASAVAVTLVAGTAITSGGGGSAVAAATPPPAGDTIDAWDVLDPVDGDRRFVVTATPPESDPSPAADLPTSGPDDPAGTDGPATTPADGAEPVDATTDPAGRTGDPADADSPDDADGPITSLWRSDGTIARLDTDALDIAHRELGLDGDLILIDDVLVWLTPDGHRIVDADHLTTSGPSPDDPTADSPELSDDPTPEDPTADDVADALLAAPHADAVATLTAHLEQRADVSLVQDLGDGQVMVATSLDLDELAALPGVGDVRPALLATSDAASPPNDPSWVHQWSQENTGNVWNQAAIADADIDVLDAWPLTAGAGQVVAVVDGGYDHTRPDLVGSVWANPGEV
ncbi:MAG TPA: hypothetical protein VK866_19020, partial [Acidimicrobiales bacterium]|nr:hypothetical protein [Acidimicrobiales bacterium]